MENNEQNNNLIKITIECLEMTFKSVDKSLRLEAEKVLKSLEVDIYNHCKTILFIIKEDNTIPKENKLSVVIYLKNMLKKKMEHNDLPKNAALEILKFYSEFLTCIEISNKIHENIVATITILLNYELLSDEKTLVIDLLNHFIQNTKNSQNISLIKGNISIIESIFMTKAVQKSNILEYLNNCIELFNNLLNGIIETYRTLDIKNNLPTFMNYNHICKSIFNFLFNSTIRLKKLSLMNKVLEVYMTKFVPIAVQMTITPIPEISPEYFIIWTENSELDSLMNLMKGKCLQFINSILLYFKKTLNNGELVKLCSTIVEPAIKNLIYIKENKFDYLSNMEKDGEVKDNNYEFFIYEILLFFLRFITKEPIIDNFKNLIKPFVLNVIIPFLVSTKIELRNMVDDGDAFVMEIMDVLEEQKNKTIKAACAQLLTKIIEKYDGVSTFIVNYCLQLTSFALEGRNLNSLNKYDLLIDNQNEWLLTKIPEELQIETTLLVMCILIEKILKNSQIFENLKKVIENNLNTLLSVDSIIIKSRMIMFLGEYVEYIFEKNTESFGICIKYLFLHLFTYTQNQGLSHQAADALSGIFSIKKYSELLQSILINFLPQLISNVTEMDFGLYFDVIYELVDHIDIDINIIELCKNLTKRIQKEVSGKVRMKIKGKDPEYSIVVNKSFNILRLICENKNYIINYHKELEEIFKELYEYLKNPKKIEFDEDLVMMLTSIIKHLNSVSVYTLELLQHLPKFLKKSKGLMLDLFDFMNQLLNHGGEQLTSSEANLKTITQIYEYSITIPLIKDGSDKSPFLGALLMQLWLTQTNKIPSNYVKIILNLTIKTIKESIEAFTDLSNLEQEPDFYVFLGMISLLYSGFVNYASETFEILITSNDMINFLDWTAMLLQTKFHNIYQAKILIVGIAAIMRDDLLVKQLPGEILLRLLSFSHTLLIKQKKEESTSLKQNLKREIDCKFVDSDSEGSNDDNNDMPISQINKFLNEESVKEFYKNFKLNKNDRYEETDEQEINEACNRIISQIKTIDEYDYFKNSIDVLVSYGKQDVIDEWVSKMSDKDKKLLDNMIHTRRITIQTLNNVVTSVPRKIMKIKRNNENTDN